MSIFRRRFGFACAVYIIVLTTAVPLALRGQVDSVHTLKEVQVTASRIDITDIGKHKESLDSHALINEYHDHLASVLARHTPLFVRTYGSGTLATLGIRGGNASHTQVMWNGIPLRNPMLGLLDLALLPSVFFDDATIHYGGHGAAFGSGAVGGLIALESRSAMEADKVQLHLSGGSWDRRMAELKIFFGGKKLRFSTRVVSQFAENNYRYRLQKGLPERNQTHHRLRNNGVLQEIVWKKNINETISGRLWYQNTDRQIPATSTQNFSRAAQQDESLRMSLEWSKQGQVFSWRIQSAWLDESIHYQDSAILLFTQNQFTTWLAESEVAFRLDGGLHVAGGLFAQVDKASSPNYLSDMSRDQFAAFSSLKWIRDHWVWRMQMREEITDANASPLLLDFSTEWNVAPKVTLKSSVSRNYRNPTLNDLFWRPGGNADLLPEKGWTLDAGIHFRHAAERIYLNISLTAYTRSMHQWIMWMPPDPPERSYWTPINIADVYSRGMEWRHQTGFKGNTWGLEIKTGLDLTWSTFETPLPEFMIEKGEQLFYIPVENILTGLALTMRSWSGYYHHHWYGSAPGINEDLKPVHLGDAGISARFSHNDLRATWYLQVENVWNTPYRIIERRPMPGRSIVGGIKFTFQNKE